MFYLTLGLELLGQWTYLQLFESNPNPGQYQRTKNLIGLVSVTHCELGKKFPQKTEGAGSEGQVW